MVFAIGIQLIGIITTAVVVLVVVMKYRQTERLLRQETRDRIVAISQSLINTGKVTYLSVDNIRTIVNEVRNISPETEIKQSKDIVFAVLAFFCLGVPGILIYWLLLRQYVGNNSSRASSIINSECDAILERIQALADTGEVNYFSLDDINAQVEPEVVSTTY